MLDHSTTSLPEYRTREVPSADLPGGRLDFAAAQSMRHRARLSGMNPNYWYPAEWAEKLAPGQHVRTSFWSAPIVVFRGEDGELGAIEDRCPHRHLPLSMGKVVGCNMVCMYHGWAFGNDGQLASVQHDTFGRDLPPVGVRTYPVQERYGLVWIFPGDPTISSIVPLPEIADTEGPDAWSAFGFDFTWKSNHSMVMDNLCNLTHLYVHGEWAPYDKTWMVHSRLRDESVELVWRHTFPGDRVSPFHRQFLMRSSEGVISETQSIYMYPYHVSHQGGARAINLMLPLSMNETRVFTLYYWKTIPVPGLSPRWRKALMERVILPRIRPSTVEVYRQDGVTVEAEMAHLDDNFFAPTPEINPAVSLFDRLNSERWQAWLDYRAGDRGDLPALTAPKRLSGDIAYQEAGAVNP